MTRRNTITIRRHTKTKPTTHREDTESSHKKHWHTTIKPNTQKDETNDDETEDT